MVELVHIDWFTWEPKSVIFYCFFHQVSALAVELTEQSSNTESTSQSRLKFEHKLRFVAKCQQVRLTTV